MPFPLDEARVQSTEEKLGARLPAAYRAKMKADNGGEFWVNPDADPGSDEWGGYELVPLLDDSDKRRFRRTWDDVIRQTALAKEWPGFPGDALVIANDSSGNKLVLRRAESDATCPDMVWKWDHETAECDALGSFDELWRAYESR